MSLISILLLLLAFGVAVWVAYILGYIKGHGVGYEKGKFDEALQQWLDSFESKRKEVKK